MTGFNRYEPPSPSTQGDENLEETFLKDVEHFHDVLPQPFRRIDKILTEIFEQAWMTIEQHKKEKQYVNKFHHNLKKVIYEEELLILDTLQDIAACGDYVIVFGNIWILVYTLPDFRNCAKYSYRDFVVAISESEKVDAVDEEGKEQEDGKEVDEDEKEEVYITSSCVIAFEKDYALMAILNSKGECEIFGFKVDTIHFVTRLTINAGDGNEDVKIEKMFFSEDSSYLSLSTKGHPQKKNSLFVYKIPKDNWMEVLGSMKSTKELQEEASRKESMREESQEDVTQEQIPQITSSLTTQHVFGKANEILRVHPTTMKPNNAHSLTSALKEVDGNSTMVGSGNHHILTHLYFDSLQRQFERHFNIQKENNDADIKSLESLATCHFLKGQLTTSLFPSEKRFNDSKEAINGIAVWWKHSNLVSVYSLTTGKDSEHSLMSVFPHANNIVLSAVNQRTNLMAVALIDGCVTIWNRFTGQPLKTFLSQDHQPINMLRFSTVHHHGCLRSMLTYGAADGKLWVMKCDTRDVDKPVCLHHRCTSSEVPDHVVREFAGPLNMLAIVWDSGEVIMYNELSCEPICQLELFNDKQQAGGCRASISLAFAGNRFVASRDESTEGKKRSRLFLFEPDNHAILQPFYNSNNNSDNSNSRSDNNNNNKFVDHSKEEVHDLETHFAHFLRSRKESEDSLLTRLASYRREFVEEEKYLSAKS